MGELSIWGEELGKSGTQEWSNSMEKGDEERGSKGGKYILRVSIFYEEARGVLIVDFR